MLRFIVAVVYKVFSLFVVVHLLSQFSRIHDIYDRCVRKEACSDRETLRHSLGEIWELLVESLTTASTNVIEVSRVLVFMAKNVSRWLVPTAAP